MKKLLLILVLCGTTYGELKMVNSHTCKDCIVLDFVEIETLKEMTFNETYFYTPNETGWQYAVQVDEKTNTESHWQIGTKREMAAFIKRIGSGGEICAVFGHQWRDGRPGEGEGVDYVSWYADYHPNVSYRTCRICGKCEKQELKWEGE
jgi:hypothetical protein